MLVLDVVFFYYGDFNNERFQSGLEHFEIKNAKALKNCKETLNGKKCLEELRSLLENQSESAVVIIKSGNALINASPTSILAHFNTGKENKGKIFYNIHSDQDYGINILSGNSQKLQKAIDDTLKTDNFDLIPHLQKSAVLDVDEKYLSRIDSWNLNQTSINTQYFEIKTSVMSTKDGRVPLVLLQHRKSHDKFDYMLNLLNKHERKDLKMPTMNDKKLHICMIFPTESMFVEEFIHFFDSQEYDRNQMSLQILVQTSTTLEDKLSKVMSTTSFHG